jgi:ribonuclease BN (tRNA processing enzyme)
MRLTILGSSASFAGSGRACAGYHLEAAGARVLFDCGNGTLANLGNIEDPVALDAVFITHGHIDHFADVYSLHAALRYAPDGPRAPMPLYLPQGLFEQMKCLLSARGASEFDDAFVPVQLEPGQPVTLGGLSVTPVAVEHTDPTFALIAEADGARLVYTSDTRPCGAVHQAAIGADLLLAEATLPEAYAGAAPHMTASQAGELAREAGARALVLTHVWPTNDRELMARIASESFGGPAVVASELDAFDIAPKVGKDH